MKMLERPLPWPNGARCAMAMTFDIDTDSFLHLEYGQRVPDMVATTSWLRYDEVAVPRLLRLFKSFNIKQTFFMPAWCMERYPHLVELILMDGHEIGHHGYLHESPNELSTDDEWTWLTRGIDIIERMTGARPRGYRAPVYNFSRNTADLLCTEGFLYDATLMADDVPYVMETSSGSLLELPSHWANDDWPQFAHSIDLRYMMTIRSPEEAFNVYRAEFDAAYAYGGLWIGVWHPWLIGRLARADQLRKFIEYVVEKGDVWIAPLEDIARHVATCIQNGTYIPRKVAMPYYREALHWHQIPQQLKR